MKRFTFLFINFALLVFILSLFESGLLYAKPSEEILFGPEWTFTNRELVRAGRKAGSHIVNTTANEAMRDEIHDLIKDEICKEKSNSGENSCSYTLLYQESYTRYTSLPKGNISKE